MGYRLQMSAEIYDWLAELRGSDLSAAVLAAQALAAYEAVGEVDVQHVGAVADMVYQHRRPERLAGESLSGLMNRVVAAEARRTHGTPVQQLPALRPINI